MFDGFARLRQSLTIIVFLRRISRELHDANVLTRARLSLDYPAWYKTNGLADIASKKITKRPKLTDIGTMDIEKINEKWREKHPELSDDDEDF